MFNVRFKAIVFAMCALAAMLGAQPVAAQLRSSRPSFGGGLMLGRNGFGAEAELRPIRWLSVTGRYEGAGLGVVETRGIGARIDIAADSTGAFYIEPLIGGVQCHPVAFGGVATGCSFDKTWMPAFALFGGVELGIGRHQESSLFVEGGYWKIRKGPTPNPKLIGFDFNMGVRFRF